MKIDDINNKVNKLKDMVNISANLQKKNENSLRKWMRMTNAYKRLNILVKED